jgi:hypothetical protein
VFIAEIKTGSRSGEDLVILFSGGTPSSANGPAAAGMEGGAVVAN